jgi:hypothetical protein
VHRFEKCLMLRDPGGVIGCFLFASYPLFIAALSIFASPGKVNPITGVAISLKNFLLVGLNSDESLTGILIRAAEYIIPSVGQDLMQLKHPTQALKSIRLVSLSIQFALQTFSHAPQSLQAILLMIILKNAKREISPSNAPAGQRELQKSLP